MGISNSMCPILLQKNNTTYTYPAVVHHNMKTPLFTAFLVLTLSQCMSQNVIETKASCLYPVIISNIKKFNTDFDFQLRFWIHGGNTLPESQDLFVMTQYKGNWTCDYYTSVQKVSRDLKLLNDYKVKKQKIHLTDSDSIWEYFLTNKILEVPDMKELQHNFFISNIDGSRTKVAVLDGETYTFEFITINSYKRINYHCPEGYSITYTHIPELKYIVNIIKLIGKKIGKQNIPC